MTEPEVPAPPKRSVATYIAAAVLGLAAGIAIGKLLEAMKAPAAVEIVKEIPRDVFHYVERPCEDCAEKAKIEAARLAAEKHAASLNGDAVEERAEHGRGRWMRT